MEQRTVTARRGRDRFLTQRSITIYVLREANSHSSLSVPLTALTAGTITCRSQTFIAKEKGAFILFFMLTDGMETDVSNPSDVK